MVDYLARDQASLTSAQWESIDRTVTEVAGRMLVGRRFLPIFGPLGPGVQSLTDDVYAGLNLGAVDLLGQEEPDVVRATERKQRPLPMIYKDFQIHWRDLETSRQFNLPLDTTGAAVASTFAAHAEDNLIFNGNAALGYEGLLNATGRSVLPLRDWSVLGDAFRDVVSGIERLVSLGFLGPYALIVPPALFAAMNRVYGNTGILEIEQVQKVATAGVFQSPVMPGQTVAIVSTGVQNMDLAIAQDIVTAFVESKGMNLHLRVLEILALRIKRPGAIVTLEAGTGGGNGRRRGRPRRPQTELESEPAEEQATETE